MHLRRAADPGKDVGWHESWTPAPVSPAWQGDHRRDGAGPRPRDCTSDPRALPIATSREEILVWVTPEQCSTNSVLELLKAWVSHHPRIILGLCLWGSASEAGGDSGLHVLLAQRAVQNRTRTEILYFTDALCDLCRTICIGMPKPPEGLVDIPIVEKEVEGHQPHYKVGLFLIITVLTVQPRSSHRSFSVSLPLGLFAVVPSESFRLWTLWDRTLYLQRKPFFVNFFIKNILDRALSRLACSNSLFFLPSLQSNFLC